MNDLAEGTRCTDKDGNRVVIIGLGTLRGIGAAIDGTAVVTYRDVHTRLVATRPRASFVSIYTPCGHTRTEVVHSHVICTACGANFGVD